MIIGLGWLNRLLASPVTGDQAEHALTHAGFPLESRCATPQGDERLDVEVTSNRGDVLCHLGCAREVAASTGIALKPTLALTPSRTSGIASVASALTLANRVPDRCPRFTAHVIEGVRVGPSPRWLAQLLESVGQRSINNVVDVTNWLNLELGHPSHAFDLDRLADASLIVREAVAGEKLTTLEGKQRTLAPGEIVVADGRQPQSLAGVIGGLESQVTDRTTRVVLEVATWAPASVRAAARRHGIRTDASARFERVVAPHLLHEIASTGAAMIAQLAGGRVLDGMLDVGPQMPALPAPSLRLAKARTVLGFAIQPAEVRRVLEALGIGAAERSDGDHGPAWQCAIPPWRAHDLTREIDLIEELGRVLGLERVPLHDRLSVRIAPPQQRERALACVVRTLCGMGFDEAVTFSFATPAQAEPFLPAGLQPVSVDEQRRPGSPTLRPSVLPGLLQCRRGNRATGADHALSGVGAAVGEGGLRFFEIASTFAQSQDSSVEATTLALLLDLPGAVPGKQPKHAQQQEGLRLMRGTIDTLVRELAGAAAVQRVRVQPIDTPQQHAKEKLASVWQPGASALVSLDGIKLGAFGLAAQATLRLFDLDVPVALAELAFEPLIAPTAGRSAVQTLPSFPSVERDVSLIVAEAVRAADLVLAVRSADRDAPIPGPQPSSDSDRALLEAVGFVGVFRGEQIGAGKKSVTVRLVYRHAARTLRREEIEPRVDAIVRSLGASMGATLRAV